MTMEWVEGARLSDRAMLETYGLEPSRLVDTMVRKDNSSISVFLSTIHPYMLRACLKKVAV